MSEDAFWCVDWEIFSNAARTLTWRKSNCEKNARAKLAWCPINRNLDLTELEYKLWLISFLDLSGLRFSGLYVQLRT